MISDTVRFEQQVCVREAWQSLVKELPPFAPDQPEILTGWAAPVLASCSVEEHPGEPRPYGAWQKFWARTTGESLPPESYKKSYRETRLGEMPENVGYLALAPRYSEAKPQMPPRLRITDATYEPIKPADGRAAPFSATTATFLTQALGGWHRVRESGIRFNFLQIDGPDPMGPNMFVELFGPDPGINSESVRDFLRQNGLRTPLARDFPLAQDAEVNARLLGVCVAEAQPKVA